MVTVVTVTVWAKKIKLFLLFRKYYKLPLSTSLNVRIRKRFIELLLVNHIFTTTHGKSVTSGLPVRSLRTHSPPITDSQFEAQRTASTPLVFSYCRCRKKRFFVTLVEKDKNQNNPFILIETSSLLVCLHAFPCEQAHR